MIDAHRMNFLINTLEHIITIAESSALKQLENQMPRKAYLKEARTIKFALPRGSGHTSLAEYLVSIYPNSIYLTPTAVDIAPFPRNSVIFTKNLEGLRGHSPYLVIIDVATLVSQSTLDEIYQRLSGVNPAPLFILLG